MYALASFELVVGGFRLPSSVPSAFILPWPVEYSQQSWCIKQLRRHLLFAKTALYLDTPMRSLQIVCLITTYGSLYSVARSVDYMSPMGNMARYGKGFHGRGDCYVPHIVNQVGFAITD